MQMEIPTPIVRTTEPRYLVIGSTGYSGADSVAWTEKSTPNIVDYDTVIVDVPSLDDATLKEVSSQTLDEIQKQLVRFLHSKGQLVIVTDHRRIDKRPNSYPEHVGNYDWCPFEVGIETESGLSLVVRDRRFDKYLSNLTRWEYYHYVPKGSLTRALTDFYGETFNTRYTFSHQPFLVNRYNRTIAGIYQIEVRSQQTKSAPYSSSYTVYPDEPDVVTGDIVVLPRIPTLDRKQAISLILEEFTGVIQGSVPPAWAKSIIVPGVIELDDGIAKKIAIISQIQNEITDLKSTKESLERFKKLLYSSGLELEHIVAASFERLGAKILPAKYSEEEFVMVFDGVEYLVEVKGVTKSISLKHLRQLTDYLLKYEEEMKSKCKGILFGNAWRDHPPDERGKSTEPEFPDNVIRRGEEFGISLVSSVWFFFALSECLEGKKDGRQALQQITTAKGIVS